MYNFLKITFIALALNTCNTKKIIHINPENKPLVTVTANAETTPVTMPNDAADDICIWINPKDVMKSTIIGTNKKEGLDVYDLHGNLLYRYKLGRLNNVDIRNGFTLNNQQVSVVTASNRSNNTITILIVTPTGELAEVSAQPIQSNLKKIYGLGMYKSPINNKIYVFVIGKSGKVEQWELFENNALIDATIVRVFDIGSQGEGIVADDVHSKVYIGEENKALWKYDAEPNTDNNRVQIISTNDLNMKSDFEGVTIYDKGNGEGYLILSSQGNNSYAVFDRVTNQYLGSFKIIDGVIDGTTDTDGIDVTAIGFNTLYPKGFFVAQDYENKEGTKTLHQNFKIVDWLTIEKELDLSN